jgi:hypothetical protein
METGKSPCAWFGNPHVEDSGICVRKLYKQQRWNCLSLSLALTTAEEPLVRISVRSLILVIGLSLGLDHGRWAVGSDLRKKVLSCASLRLSRRAVGFGNHLSGQ